jgi:hypothetical protein
MYWQIMSPLPAMIPLVMHFVARGFVSSFLAYQATIFDRDEDEDEDEEGEGEGEEDSFLIRMNGRIIGFPFAMFIMLLVCFCRSPTAGEKKKGPVTSKIIDRASEFRVTTPEVINSSNNPLHLY